MGCALKVQFIACSMLHWCSMERHGVVALFHLLHVSRDMEQWSKKLKEQGANVQILQKTDYRWLLTKSAEIYTFSLVGVGCQKQVPKGLI